MIWKGFLKHVLKLENTLLIVQIGEKWWDWRLNVTQTIYVTYIIHLSRNSKYIKTRVQLSFFFFLVISSELVAGVAKFEIK